ncbi:MAG TPA: hypothetical protein PK198_23830, partial [Saprospiraceae bacterium]|nr:hypothetical protein [Saprospiraceae bacterium]
PEREFLTRILAKVANFRECEGKCDLYALHGLQPAAISRQPFPPERNPKPRTPNFPYLCRKKRQWTT